MGDADRGGAGGGVGDIWSTGDDAGEDWDWHGARREVRQVDTAYGSVQIKLKYVGDELAGATAEFEDCKALAERANVPVRQILESANAAAQALLATLRSAK